MPRPPVSERVETISTSSSKIFPSGVRTSTGKLLLAIALRAVAVRAVLVRVLGLVVLVRAARVLDDLVDRALHVEGALGDVVVLALDDLLEGAHGVLDGYVLALRAGELLGHEERLGEEALHLARALDELAVVVGELVDAEDRDDVLQLLVTLQRLLDLHGDVVVLLADDVWLEDGRGRVERVDGRVDALLGDRPRQCRGS